MPVINRIAGYAEEMKTWRRWIHAHPELRLECHETAAYVAARLRDFGVDEIHERIGVSGIVAIIEGQGGRDGGPTLGLRADMDALPMQEMTDLPYASTVSGRMHACGHDGHTTMLLGAAKYLAETRNFSGRVALIFQPAEEGGAGAKVMVEEGIMERFGIDEVYALHNAPEGELGTFVTTAGALMAAVDTFDIHVKGKGGHAAHPEAVKDPLIAAVAIVQSLQTIVSRNLDPMDNLVVGVTQIHAGSADNVVPDEAYIQGTVRSFTPEVRDLAERRIREIATGTATTYEVTAEVIYDRGYPPTVNHAAEVEKAARAARDISGAERVITNQPPEMGAEDFAYMLEARPGAYLFLSQGKGPGLHHPKYDFNDEVAPVGASFFARLVETLQPA